MDRVSHLKSTLFLVFRHFCRQVLRPCAKTLFDSHFLHQVYNIEYIKRVYNLIIFILLQHLDFFFGYYSMPNENLVALSSD